MVLDRSGGEVDIRDVRFDVRSTVRVGKLFYREREYVVDVDLALPGELKEGSEYEATLRVSVENFAEEVAVKLSALPELVVEPAELRGAPPLEGRVRVRTSRPGTYSVAVTVYGAGKKLEERSVPVAVKGKCIVLTKPCNEVNVAGALLVSVEASDVYALLDVVRLLKMCRGSAVVKANIATPGGRVSVDVEACDHRVLEVLQSALITLARSEGAEVQAKLGFTPEGEVTADLVKDKSYMCVVRVCES